MGVLGLTVLAGAAMAVLPNAYRMTIDGQVVAIAGKKEYIDAALNTIEVQLQNQYGTAVKLGEIDEVKKVHASKKELTDPSKLATYLREALPVEVEFQKLIVDNKEIGIIESEATLDLLMEELKGKYFRDKEVNARFVNDIELEPVFTTEDSLIDMKELVNLASQRNKEIIEYTVVPGDSLWLIADKLGASMLDILSQNDGMTETSTLRIGQTINVQIKVPVIGLEIIEPEAPEIETTGETAGEATGEETAEKAEGEN